MNELLRVYDNLSTRIGFNESLRHFQSVMDIISDFEEGFNVADILNTLISYKEINQNQVPSIISALMADKYSYYSKSFNMITTTTDFTFIKQELKKLKAYDVVISYYHPELGYLVINPKNPESWGVTNEFRKNEYLTIFLGTFADKPKTPFPPVKTAEYIFNVLNGKKNKIPDQLKKGKYNYTPYEMPGDDGTAEEENDYYADNQDEIEASEPIKEDITETPSGPESVGPMNMTPLYSVPVTNELFHNGNVEAWKRIIQSYKAKHPDLEVHIFYDNERILNIASLFKWGKVKHGSSIYFAVAGDDITDVAKLQKYFKQGASPQFEAFLKFPVNTVLNLF